uniref:Uncharacterized protein n=1 Tax=viral metagenome TaxID=1070528 RepID=A0A6M3J4W3_9ZZZZ
MKDICGKSLTCTNYIPKSGKAKDHHTRQNMPCGGQKGMKCPEYLEWYIENNQGVACNIEKIKRIRGER